MKAQISSICLFMLVAGTGHATESDDPVIAAVMARDAEIAAAHGRGDMAAYRDGLSKRYV